MNLKIVAVCILAIGLFALPVYAWKSPDVNGDGKVDLLDIGLTCQAFGHSIYCEATGCHKYNPAVDFNEDGFISMKDIGYVAKNFGRTF